MRSTSSQPTPALRASSSSEIIITINHRHHRANNKQFVLLWPEVSGVKAITLTNQRRVNQPLNYFHSIALCAQSPKFHDSALIDGAQRFQPKVLRFFFFLIIVCPLVSQRTRPIRLACISDRQECTYSEFREQKFEEKKKTIIISMYGGRRRNA